MTTRVLQTSDRIAIINRGESAMRFINAVRDFNLENNTELKTIALYTKPDERAKFVQQADYSYCLGDSLEPDLSQMDENGMPLMKSPYLVYARLEQALTEMKAGAVWVGWGFVAEHAEFVDLCDSIDVVFIGPTGDSMRMLGDKIGSKHLAEDNGVAVTPWSSGPVPDVKAAKVAAKKIGYPLVVKATAGGGGRGIRKVFKDDELEAAFDSATAEAAKAFGDGTVFMEKMIVDARHLEVQILADNHGVVWPVGVRDCSVQRRHQKVIEEGPAVILDEAQDKALRAAAVRVAEISNYRNAGTAEFLYTDGEFYFMEMNTRLQVEHPVTEVTTGIDMVKMQIRMAMGEKLVGEPPVTHGHAVEVRLNAEDPYNQFSPSPGKIELFSPPGGPGLRVDSGVETGSEIPSSFDSMVAKIIAYGATRDEAIARLARGLQDTQIVIEDGTSNKAFLLELLNHPVFLENTVSTAWLDRMMEDGLERDESRRAAALVVAGIELYTRIVHEKRQEFFQTVSRGRPQKVPVFSAVEVEMKLAGQGYKLQIHLLEPDYYRCHCGDACFDVKYIRDTEFKGRLYYNETKYECMVTSRQDDLDITIDGASYLVAQDSGGLVKSNSPAVVLNIHVNPGQLIEEGDPLITLEAMKMEMIFQSPSSGRVGQVFVKKNQQVAAGDPILVIEEDSAGGEVKVKGSMVTFVDGSLPEKEVDLCQRIFRECHSFMLGYDVHQFSFDNMLKQIPEIVSSTARNAQGRNDLSEFLQEICNLFFDVEYLFLKEVSVSEIDISSPEQNFFTFLQLMRTGQQHPAEDFVEKLQKALEWYGVEHDGPVDPLEEAIIHIFFSHDHQKLKTRLLQTWFHAIEATGRFSNSRRLKVMLEKIVTQARLSFSSVYHMAIDTYYHIFEKSCFDMSVEHAWADLDETMGQLKISTGGCREDLMRKVAYSPHSLLKYFIRKFKDASTDDLKLYAELLMRRIHLEYTLKGMAIKEQEGIVFICASYVVDRKKMQNVSFSIRLDQLEQALDIAENVTQTCHDCNEVILDFYIHTDGNRKDDDYAAEIDQALSNFKKTPLLSRVRFVIGDDFPLARCFHFHSYRSGFREKRLYRGISEMLAERVYLERLQGFDTVRLSTEENINLFFCVAKENQDDQRLIAFNEVREPAPPADNIFSYPALHREFLMIMKAMRHSQEKYVNKGSFYWNQVIIYIRPLLNVGREEFLAYLRKIITGYQQVHLEKIRIYVLLAQPHGDVANLQVEVSFPGGLGLELKYTSPTTPAIEPLSGRDFRQALARRRRLNYPYETVRLLTDGYFYKGEFEEFDLLEENGELQLTSVKGRPSGGNQQSIVFGIITNFTPAHPDGMRRVIILGDGNFGLGCLSEPECRRVMAAMSLAREHSLPIEWFAISSGAKISMDNGTENLDWTADVLRDIIDFTQAGGEINIIVDGINVGAQSYWNAEATMLMHTKGCLIMTPRGCMVLTGKSALDYSGSVSAEDNVGIGGLQRIMGPNGQVQYPANNLLHACEKLFRYYAYTYVAPGKRYPNEIKVSDPDDRNICEELYSFDGTPDFSLVGDIFSEEKNPGKKKPFDMRQVMQAVVDKGQRPIERWPLVLDGDTAIVWDTSIGGICCSVLGIQSHPIKRRSEVPNDGPDSWSGGTLFPQSSRKLARALNAASGRRPVVILANLSGFDGSPESLRRFQLEYGAEIGRAVVNFDGPIIFCILSRYHGGAYVVFSKRLNPNLKSIALEGTYASVIGGAPAAAVVFVREVRKRTLSDPRVSDLQEKINASAGIEKTQLEIEYKELYTEVLREKQGLVAAEFDNVHTVQRAKDVGSLDDIIKPETLRPYIIQSLRERMS